MSVMTRKFESQAPPSVTQDSSPLSVPLHESSIAQNQNMPTPSVQMNILQPTSHFVHPETRQFKEAIPARVNK